MAAGLAFAAPAPTTVKPFTAYHDGDAIVFTPEITGTRRMASFGPWNLGERLSDGKPMDGRLNLYVVVPGTQYRSATKPEYNHNRKKYRRKNRSLPRLLIIPAGLAVRATAELPDVTITHFGQPSSPMQ